MKRFFISTFLTMIFIMTVGAVAVFYFDVLDEEDAVKVMLHGDFENDPNFDFKSEPIVEVYIEDYEEYDEYESEEWVCPYTVTILLSAAGDTTLGGDRRWAGYGAFLREFEDSGRDHSHFFSNVAHIFYESDLSILNLEGVLTYVTEPHMDKEFVFRGPPHFARILYYGHIDAVSLANNHTRDFFLRGYNDTRAALDYVGVAYFGNYFNRIMEVNGIKVGLFGHRIWADHLENRNRITAAIEYLRNQGAQLIIAFNHWGVEGENFPEHYQRTIGRFTLQQGADLVLGAHPHVIQGIEEYNGRFIVHSLADFCFGGNAAPSDQDTFIFQQLFTFYRGVLQDYTETTLIPARVSSVRYRNDFRPTIAEGDDAERILARIERYSEALR
ncbi:MAG: CapA family protein [Defluviitaleaceae bacterium]|nr:CapA family protein [Defluviitaleaceae bacterium]